jgi:(p)ppGpp synthase/HD superfamily hydrolase
MTTIIDKASDFARAAHGDQKYGGKPYMTHLVAVGTELSLIAAHWVAQDIFPGPPELINVMGAAAYLHDVLEDTAVTLADLRAEFGDAVADLVWAVTDEPGANRAERKARTLPKIRAAGPVAVALKLSDRNANVAESVVTGNYKMLQMYRDENPIFKAALYRAADHLDKAWERLDFLFHWAQK